MSRCRKHAAWLALSLAGCLMLIGLAGCSTTGTTGNLLSTTHFSQGAYDMAKELKDESLALIDKAKYRTPYSWNADDVHVLMQKIENAIVVENERMTNVPTIAEWETIRSQLSHFFALWKRKGTLSLAFVEEGKNQVNDLFDTLIRTEEDKRARG
jgi:hypothetical protein